jgi:hypothetical protein
LFTTGCKRLTEGGCEALVFGWGRLLILAFWIWEAFGSEFCWREISEGGK